jgi:hypothetical protein
MGVPVKIAQEQLGHASPTTTLSIYTHTVPEAQRNAVSRLADQLFPDVPKLLQAAAQNSRQLGQVVDVTDDVVGPPGFEPGTDGL